MVYSEILPESSVMITVIRNPQSGKYRLELFYVRTDGNVNLIRTIDGFSSVNSAVGCAKSLVQHGCMQS